MELLRLRFLIQRRILYAAVLWCTVITFFTQSRSSLEINSAELDVCPNLDDLRFFDGHIRIRREKLPTGPPQMQRTSTRLRE